MFSHQDIWIAIDRLARNSGYSTSGLARKAGLDATAFNKSKRMSPEGKPRWPSTESLAKILSVTNVTMTDFMTLIEIDTHIHTIPYSQPHQTIPVIRYDQAGAAGYFDEYGTPRTENWDAIELSSIMPSDDSLYALEISDHSMAPFYKADDILIISSNTGIRRGDRVFIKTADEHAIIGELVRQTATKIELKLFTPEHNEIALTSQEIRSISRIIWASQ